MAEYINKEQLLSHLFNKQDEPLDVMKEIAEFPAADVAEVHHARWEEAEWHEYDAQSMGTIRFPI